LISSRSRSSAFGVFLQHRPGGLECRSDRVHRRRRGRGGRDGLHQQVLHHLRAVEQDLALVGVVAEERALGQSGPHGDLRHGGLLEPLLGVELHGRLCQPAASVRLPSTHGMIVRDDSD
jgi:hypothetical protein